MGRVKKESLMKALPYNVAFLGLVIIILSVFVLVLQKEGTPDAPATASPQASTSTDRLIESLQSRLKVRPNDTDSSVQLGSTYLEKASTGSNPYCQMLHRVSSNATVGEEVGLWEGWLSWFRRSMASS